MVEPCRGRRRECGGFGSAEMKLKGRKKRKMTWQAVFIEPYGSKGATKKSRKREAKENSKDYDGRLPAPNRENES